MRSSTKKEKEIKRLTQNNRVKTNEKRQKTMISSKKKKQKHTKADIRSREVKRIKVI